MAAVTLRYAQAFADVVAASQLDREQVRQQLDDFAGTLAGSRELRELLENPSIDQATKVKVLDAVGGRIGFGRQVRNFLAVLTAHDRMEMLGEVLDAYNAIADRQAGISEAEIISAHPLTNEDKALLEQKAGALAGGKVRASYTQDASLLGGAIIRIGSTLYDGSVKAQLAQLKQKLVNA